MATHPDPAKPGPINPEQLHHTEMAPGHHPGHDHPDFLGHHWETPQQQFEAGKLGMWLFLATEVLLFGGLFVAYAVWRHNHPEVFAYGSRFLDTTMGATNTVVLILSSLTMAWAVTAAQRNQQFLLKLMLILTLIGAAMFMVIKYFEYTHKFHLGLYPGPNFYSAAVIDPAGPPPDPDLYLHARAAGGATAATPTPQGDTGFGETPETRSLIGVTVPATPQVDAPPARAAIGPRGLAAEPQLVERPFRLERPHAAEPEFHPVQDRGRPANAHMFFNIYFMMTGLHGIHVLVGMIVITWLLIRSFKGHFNSNYFTPVDLGGLYWHIVDLIWIFLFPLFYLI